MDITSQRKNLTVFIPRFTSKTMMVECLVIDPLEMLLNDALRAKRLLKEFQERKKEEKVDVFHVHSTMEPKKFVTQKLNFSWSEYQDGFICRFEVPSSVLSDVRQKITQNED